MQSKTGPESADILFLSFNESNADKNWMELKRRFPHALRIHGVSGIRQAHRIAAELSRTKFFFVVDGDNRLRPDFHFALPEENLRTDTLYVWRCENPANNLVYGYGAIKLYNKTLVQDRAQKAYVDLATTVTEHYKIVPVVASETHFFSTPEEAWRGAFRECAKLAAGIIDRQKELETLARLEQWCSHVNPVPHAKWVLKGALEGRLFGASHRDQIAKINDFNWLKQRFLENE